MTAQSGLTPLLGLVDSPVESAVEYAIGGAVLTGAARETAAQLLADDAMSVAFGESPALDSWRQRRDGGPPHAASRQKVIQTYAGIAFGYPGHEVNEHHVQGHVAELVWSRVMSERSVCRDGRRLHKAHPVKADPLEPGGDGLIIYQNVDDVFVFRLWEIKKHESQGEVSGTINRASKQLKERGAEYLAKLAGPETLDPDSPVGELYANIVELWWDRSDRAGVGVSIGTSHGHEPKRPTAFGSIKKAFPEFTASGQTEGLVVAIPDFPGFAERVKEIVWSGL
jgi:hypothetical protein